MPCQLPVPISPAIALEMHKMHTEPNSSGLEVRRRLFAPSETSGKPLIKGFKPF